LTVPILWVRLRPAVRLALAAWPMLLLFGWFALTTQWALDPDASVRRVLVLLDSASRRPTPLPDTLRAWLAAHMPDNAA